jgi:hypothetical protein
MVLEEALSTWSEKKAEAPNESTNNSLGKSEASVQSTYKGSEASSFKL